MGRTGGWLFMLLVPALLAGCLGGEEPLDPATGRDGTDPQDDESPQGATKAGPLLRENNETIREHSWVNDTFAAHETQLAGGFLTHSSQHEIEFTEPVPLGVPVQIRLNLTWDADTVESLGVFAPELSIGYTLNNIMVYSQQTQRPEAGRLELTHLVERTDPEGSLVYWVSANRPQAGAEAEIGYSLEVDLRTLPDRIPPGQVVEAPLEGGDTITFHTAGEKAQIRIYDGEDRYMDDLDVTQDPTFTVPKDQGGDYVFAVWGDGDSVVAIRDNGSVVMRPLDLKQATGEWTAYPGTGEESWTHDVDDHPLATGILVRDPQEPHELTPSIAQSVSGEIQLPNGETVSSGASYGCIVCMGTQLSVIWTPMADPRLEPGTYEWTVSSGSVSTFEYTEYIVRYER